MKNIFSIDSATQKLQLAAKRFPISILFIIAFACLLFINININPEIEIPNILLIFFSFGAVISTVLVLWIENSFNYIKQQIITFATVLLWGTYCFFLPINDEIYAAECYELVGIGIAVFLSFFFISFLKKDKDKAFWNFTIQTGFQICISVLFGLTIWIGLFTAAIAISYLFGIKFIGNLSFNLPFICFILFAYIYSLVNVPDKISKYNEEISLNKYLKILALYILTPIVVIYAAILYVYLFKIIFTWELPEGSVSYLVSALAFSVLCIITLLYPIRLEEKNKFIVFLYRYSGIIMFPLFALMTIGIFRRISDYGITIFRCYILLINIWFYGIYIYLFITKATRIKFIFISFAAISLLVSVGFWSVPNITKNKFISELNSDLGDQKISLLDDKIFHLFEYSLDSIDEKYREKVIDKILYLYKKYEIKNIQPFFSDDVSQDGFKKNINFYYNEYNDIKNIYKDNEKREKKINERIDKNSEYCKKDKDSGNFNFIKKGNKFNDIKNFNTFVDFSSYSRYSENDIKNDINFLFNNGDVTIKIVPDNRNFHVPMRSLTKDLIIENINNDKSCGGMVRFWDRLEDFTFQGSDYEVLIEIFEGNYYKTQDSMEVHGFGGFLFYNR